MGEQGAEAGRFGLAHKPRFKQVACGVVVDRGRLKCGTASSRSKSGIESRSAADTRLCARSSHC
jgi:hypothetical protein